VIFALRLFGRSAARVDDRSLVEACIEGDEESWATLVDLYHGFVINVSREALRRAGADDPESLAEDVTGELFAELLANDCKALTRFRAPFSLKAWLAVIARRKASRSLRTRRRAGQSLEEPQQIAADLRSVASDVAQIETCERVKNSLEALPARDRLALQLFYEGGHSYKEVAKILDLPVSRIGTLLARARKRLSRVLDF
jgi:RNA polymerase sigma-70 factor, ECF subfamily